MRRPRLTEAANSAEVATGQEVAASPGVVQVHAPSPMALPHTEPRVLKCHCGEAWKRKVPTFSEATTRVKEPYHENIATPGQENSPLILTANPAGAEGREGGRVSR